LSRLFFYFFISSKEHKCEFIFRFSSLDVGALANSYALLRLPKIPELRGKDALSAAGFVPDFSVKTEDVPFLDKSRERARRKRLEVAKEASAAAAKLEAEKAAEAAAGRGGKQLSGAEKKRAKAMELALAANPHWNEDGPRKRKGKHEQMVEEWDDLAKEERLFKKLRKGKITQKQYDDGLKGISKEESDDDEDGNGSDQGDEDSD
jgi:ATP-dependent RNA helicase DDX55/SPB4